MASFIKLAHRKMDVYNCRSKPKKKTPNQFQRLNRKMNEFTNIKKKTNYRYIFMGMKLKHFSI